MIEKMVSVDIDGLDLKIQNLKKLLSRYRDYKQIERELKINALLGVKSQLEITEMDSYLYCSSDYNEIVKSRGSLTNVSFIVKGIIITFDEYLNIIEMLLDIKIPNTQYGKVLTNIINNGIEVIFNPIIIDENILNFTNSIKN